MSRIWATRAVPVGAAARVALPGDCARARGAAQAGLLAHEHAYVQAGQSVPLA